MLARMDVERNLESIEIEAKVNNSFDDLKVISDKKHFYFQIKDLENISLGDLKVTKRTLKIRDNPHALSTFTNVVFFKKIDILPNTQILGFRAVKLKDVYIVSLSHENIGDTVNDLYDLDRQRQQIITKFFNVCLDTRKFKIERQDLPSIHVFDTNLIESTIDLGRSHLAVKNILVIEGKPGVGKSHLVSSLIKEFPNNILYRFWTSSQDKDYNQRLQFKNFLFDFSKKLFHDQVVRTQNQILRKLANSQKTVIIDGFDHIENYNKAQLTTYLDFVQELQRKCKVILLSRPLKYKIRWAKHELNNWNESQTLKVLSDLFHIVDYKIGSQIYEKTNGYPILVKYFAEHYKKHKKVPSISSLNTIDEYYTKLFSENARMKNALSLFLCSRSFYMDSEIELFLGKDLAVMINEFIEEYPYLFERRLNRVSLLHDSFNTYLRKLNIDYASRKRTVDQIVTKSILAMKTKFLSRADFFDLKISVKKRIVTKYASLSTFERLVEGQVDYEAIQTFYGDLREWITELSPNDLEIIHYYELSLIFNIINRNHISAHNQFLYTFSGSLMVNGYNDDDITSSGYLFAMWYYRKTSNANLLRNLTSNDFYDTSRFIESLNEDIEEEESVFERHEKPLSKARIETLLARDTEHDLQKRLTFVLENLFLHSEHHSDFPELTECINNYIESSDENAIAYLEDFLEQRGVRHFRALWSLKEAKANLLALGSIPRSNDYLLLSLKKLIFKNRRLGSFNLSTEILNYLRLSLHIERSIDLSSISVFWTKFYQRKDYTLIGIPATLKVWEDRNLSTQDDSVRLIMAIQSESEKGHRGLLADYIELKPPEFLDHLNDNYQKDDLHISWFTLPARYINRLPDRFFNDSLNELLRYHHSNKQIDFSEVEHVLNSNRCNELKSNFEFFKFNVRVRKKSPEISIVKKKRIPFTEYEDTDKSYRSDSRKRLSYGILTAKDKNLIVRMKMKPEVVAGFSDNNHSALSDPEIFDIFSKRKIKKSIKPILYNAMVGKLNSLNAFNYLYEYASGLLKLVNDYDIPVNYNRLFDAFKRSITLSMLDFGSKKPRKKKM